MALAHHARGFLVVDKPAGLTSRDAVDHVQNWFPKTKLGHAGTLDPAATGVLVVGVGPTATRLIEFLQEQEKQYHTVFRLDGVSSTDDADGDITSLPSVTAPTVKAVQDALHRFIGTISQVPPAFSAAKVAGVRAHTRARQGEQFDLKPRQVTIHDIKMLRYAFPELELDIRCSKGTYIRSIARDLGKVLNTGGYVQSLRRTRIGRLTCELAIPWESTAEQINQKLLPYSTAAEHLIRINLSADEARRLQQGQRLQVHSQAASGNVAVWCGDFIGIGLFDAVSGRLKPVKMLASEM